MKLIFFILTIFLFAVVGVLAFIFVVSLLSQSTIPKLRYLSIHISNTIGGAIGYSAIILIIEGVSKISCTVGPILVDLSLMVCGGVISFSSTQKFVAEYHDFSQARYFSPKTVYRVLFTLWTVLVLLNLIVLVGTFLYQHPGTQLHLVEKNIYENRCTFGLVSVIAIPSSIVLVFLFSLLVSFLKIFIHTAVATQRIEVFNSATIMVTLGAMVVAAVTFATIDPTQTQIDITICTVIIVSNLNAPINLFGWLFSAKRRNLLFNKKETIPLIPRRQALRGSVRLFPDFTSLSPFSSPATPSLSSFSPATLAREKSSISAADLNV